MQTSFYGESFVNEYPKLNNDDFSLPRPRVDKRHRVPMSMHLNDAVNVLCQSVASPYRFDFLEVSDITDNRQPRVINIENDPIESQGRTLTKQFILDQLKLLNGRSSMFQRNAKSKYLSSIIHRWNNGTLYDVMTGKHCTTREDFEAQKNMAYMRGVIPALESKMIQFSNELSSFGIQIHFQFPSAVELMRFFKNTQGLSSKPHPDLFKQDIFHQEMFKDKPLTDKITGYPLMLSAPVPVQHGVQRNHGIQIAKVNEFSLAKKLTVHRKIIVKI